MQFDFLSFCLRTTLIYLLKLIANVLIIISLNIIGLTAYPGLIGRSLLHILCTLVKRNEVKT
jgi:hypothetical protein